MPILKHPMSVALLLVVALAVAPGALARTARSIERAIETGSPSLLLPSFEGGTLTANNCAKCRTESASVTPQTRYFAREQQVPLAALRAALAASGPVSVTVFVDVKTSNVTRVVADLAMPRAQNR